MLSSLLIVCVLVALGLFCLYAWDVHRKNDDMAFAAISAACAAIDFVMAALILFATIL